MSDGWVYVDGKPEWRPSVAAMKAEIHCQLDRWYGEEYDSLAEWLDDLENAVRREWADKLRNFELEDVMGRNFYTGAGIDFAADLIDPHKEDPK
ncbi:hypothetical protein [Streptomyces phage phiScoe23]|uniref:Uncharacterized protein n=7 Tax=Likavirus TaxID=1982880 RepID=A0A411CVK8_9CAUD|nr:hypothetical protein FDI80_gp59 [Streptomyces phage Aaronocolus]ATE85240.1 hypothetical protein SEA_ESPERER_60 [Streptomyces phage Esperer]ATE85462.1 hypothetical protein SEA_OZZIE_58 [Streptomyces phage Ozzie]QAY17334.1 hypothetical protein SEA_INDIGO_58 [Streptomyces phage Indigo]QAY17876.1 hypothetical protein SEA_NERDOS_58 [Streptomyces phage Nerdos]QDK03425.1 hypothetical protein SEA_LEVITICUS_60 [Streptomyces phage Leviticus]QGJ91576.1 hypothetical protein SEA_PHETTUCCINE_59 [Strepto